MPEPKLDATATEQVDRPKPEVIETPKLVWDPNTATEQILSSLCASTTPAETLSSAKARKQELENKTVTAKPRTRVEDERENRIIKHLRDKEKKQWSEIAARLNHRRKQLGLPEDMTVAAVYSRYIRSTAIHRRTTIEVGLNVVDYMHLRPPKHQIDPTLAGGPAPGSAPKKILKSRRLAPKAPKILAFPEIKEFTNSERYQLTVNTRKIVKIEDAEADLAMPARTHMVVEAVGVVKRNFWIYVADELERLSGKLYEAKAVEKRYNAI